MNLWIFSASEAIATPPLNCETDRKASLATTVSTGRPPGVPVAMLAASRIVSAIDTATPAPLPGSPKRKLRECALLHRKPLRIPSAHASGFKARDRQTRHQSPGRRGSLEKLRREIRELRPKLF